MPEPQTLMTGIVFGESPRWHDDRLWFSDWGAQEVVAVDLEGESEVIVRVPSSPFCIDWLPDGRRGVPLRAVFAVGVLAACGMPAACCSATLSGGGQRISSPCPPRSAWLPTSLVPPPARSC